MSGTPSSALTEAEARELVMRCARGVASTAEGQQLREYVDVLAARVEQLEADARLALAGLPDPMHPKFNATEAGRLAAAQVLIANLAGEDDPGNVESSRAALALAARVERLEAAIRAEIETVCKCDGRGVIDVERSPFDSYAEAYTGAGDVIVDYFDCPCVPLRNAVGGDDFETRERP